MKEVFDLLPIEGDGLAGIVLGEFVERCFGFGCRSLGWRGVMVTTGAKSNRFSIDSTFRDGHGAPFTLKVRLFSLDFVVRITPEAT